jgi:hypothetical protein
MEASGTYLHAPAASGLAQKRAIHLEHEAGWVTQPVWMWKRKILARFEVPTALYVRIKNLLEMASFRTPETSVSFYQTTWFTTQNTEIFRKTSAPTRFQPAYNSVTIMTEPTRFHYDLPELHV